MEISTRNGVSRTQLGSHEVDGKMVELVTVEFDFSEPNLYLGWGMLLTVTILLIAVVAVLVW